MRVEVLGNEVEPGDQVWFPNNRRPQPVVQVEDRSGAQRLCVLHSDTGTMWHMLWDSGKVFKYVPDPAPSSDDRDYLDPDGNPT